MSEWEQLKELIRYKASSGWHVKIEIHHFHSETETSLRYMYDGKLRRVAKETAFCKYFKTFAEARDWLIARHTARVEQAEDSLKRHQDDLKTAILISASNVEEIT